MRERLAHRSWAGLTGRARNNTERGAESRRTAFPVQYTLVVRRIDLASCTTFKAASKASSSPSRVVSRILASAAGRSGAAARAASLASRACNAAVTDASDAACCSCQRRSARASSAGRHEQLHVGIRENHGADVAAVQHRRRRSAKPRWKDSKAARTPGTEATRLDARSSAGPRRSVRARSSCAAPRPAACASAGSAGSAPRIQHPAADRPVEQPGIQVGQTRAPRPGAGPACPCQPQPGRRWRRSTACPPQGRA